MTGEAESTRARRAERLLAALDRADSTLAACEDDPERYELYVAGERAPRLVAPRTLIDWMRERELLSGDAALGHGPAASAWRRRRARPDDGWRAQHLALSPAPEEAPEAAARVDNDSPLSWLRRRRGPDGAPLLSSARHAAGERLYADFVRAGLTPRITADWSGVVVGKGRRGPANDPAAALDACVAARRRFARAVDALLPELASLVVDVCCFQVGLEDAERRRGWPRRSAKIVLCIALSQLADHYGLADEARRTEAAGLRHWGTEDYRPVAGA